MQPCALAPSRSSASAGVTPRTATVASATSPATIDRRPTLREPGRIAASSEDLAVALEQLFAVALDLDADLLLDLDVQVDGDRLGRRLQPHPRLAGGARQP